jgi:hypothetical protein
MSRNIFIPLAAALLPLTFAWSAAAGGDLPPHAYGDGPSCDLRVAHDGGGLVLEGLVFAPAPASGSYELEISQGSYAGGSNIRQGGDFAVAPGTDGSLGVVSLPEQGGYAATLIVHWHDGAPDCTRHVGNGRRL